MKTLKYLWLAIIIPMWVACYEDKGNYDYQEINEVSIAGVDSVYNRDQFDSLRIQPDFTGTQYSDEERFTFQWEINKKIVSNERNLEYEVRLPLGQFFARLMITDRALGTMAQTTFRIRVSSSTAADMIIVLSNYKGRSELSYCRLDKENAKFVSNYYYEGIGEILGTNPVALEQSFNDADNASYGLYVLSGDGLKIIDKNTMEPKGNMDENFFRKIAPPLPIPEFKDYKPEGIKTQILDWSIDLLFGDVWPKSGYIHLISGGRSYYYYKGAQSIVTLNKQSPYGGYLSPVYFPSTLVMDTDNDGWAIQRGYRISNYFLLFDETAGKFVLETRGGSKLEKLEELPVFEGYKLKYGTAVMSDKNNCVAILNQGERVKALLLKTPANSTERTSMPFEVLAEGDMPSDVMNAGSHFHLMSKTPDLFFSTDDKVFRTNVLDWKTSMPSSSARVFDLSRFEYGSDARITCMYVTRSEENIILGVSRYGNDTEGNSEELKGDILVINAKDYSLVGKYEGVAGYPVDVIVKYQYYFRGGCDEYEQKVDNI